MYKAAKDRNELLDQAFELAEKAHRKQKRKGSQIPYIAHPMAVASLVMEAGASDHVVAAALLHDVVEDTDITEMQLRSIFGNTVTDLVMAVTSPPIDWKQFKDEQELQKALRQFRLNYFQKLKTASTEVQILSAADKLHNARNILQDLKRAGMKASEVWDRYRGKRGGTTWYYRNLANTYIQSEDREVQRLGMALSDVVAEMDGF